MNGRAAESEPTASTRFAKDFRVFYALPRHSARGGSLPAWSPTLLSARRVVPPAKSGSRKPIVDAPFLKASEVTDQVTKPERFAYGFVVNGKHFHATFATLRKSPVQNLTLDGRPLLLTFDPESTAARLFSRRLDDRDLTFVAADHGLIRDTQTGSLWNRTRGIAVDGPLKAKQLDHEPAIITFTRKWKLFHEDSTEVPAEQQP